MIQDVTTQDAAFAVDQEIPASKYPVQENHVEEHDGREARTPIKPDKLAVLVWQRSDTDSLRRIAWQKRYVRARIQQEWHIGDDRSTLRVP